MTHTARDSFISTCVYHICNLPVVRQIAFALLLLAAGRTLADASEPATKTPVCVTDSVVIAGLNGDASIDIKAVSNYIETVAGMLKAGRFRQIDCLAASARFHKERFPGGMWKLHAIYSGLEKPPLHATPEDWGTHMKLVQKWVATNPRSTTARVALAESYVDYGEDARGSGYGDTVSDSGWRLLAERTAKAKKILDEASAHSMVDAEWYVAMQGLALHQGWEKEARRALLDKAVKFEPEYYYYYRYFSNSILPKWGGGEGEVESFLEESADHIGGDAGDILYFRVAADLVCGCQSDESLKFSLPRIQKGFAAVEKKNGPSPENLNLMAHAAISFGDALVADKVFTRIGDQWSEEIWKTSSYYESSKQWAKQIADAVNAKRVDAEQSAGMNLHTSEGQNYNAEFAEKVTTLMEPCLEAAGSIDLPAFELVLKVGKDGTIEDMTGTGVLSPLTKCLGHKLADFQKTKQAVFAPPPQPDYWVRFDFNPKQSTSAALK